MKFKCEICDYTTFRKDHLKKHYSTKKHKRNMSVALNGPTDNVSKNEKICELCGKIYKSRQSLYRHRKACIGKKEEKDKQIIEQLKKELDKKYKCEFCEKKYVHRQTLFKHKKQKHNFTVKKNNEEKNKQIEDLQKKLKSQLQVLRLFDCYRN